MRAAHLKNVAHLDLKPENILLDEHERMYLCDFGLARCTYGDGRLTCVDPYGGAGTDLYMAPEQRDSGQPVTLKADVYAFGKVMKELLDSAEKSVDAAVAAAAAAVAADACADRPYASGIVTSQLATLHRLMADVVAQCTHEYPRRRPDVFQLHKMLLELRSTYAGRGSACVAGTARG